jgi:LacI family transcriptional regulator
MSTLRALAGELGLSITTVSRALDGYEDVARATRERVVEAARAAGYRPNPAARRLRKGASETVAVVMPTGTGRFYEPVFVELLAVVGNCLARRHYDLVLMAAAPGAEEAAVYKRIVADRRADACILVRTRRNDPRVRFLSKAGLPFVCHGRVDHHEPYAFVDGDGATGVAAVTTRLIASGHRAIAHISGPSEFTFSGIRADGYREAMQQAGLQPWPVGECAMNEDGGYAAAEALLRSANRPTALVCATDRLAIGAIRAAQAAGLVVGRDIAISGHDNIHASAFTSPGLTTMEHDPVAVGACLADMLLARIGGASPDGMQQIFPLKQVPRGSTGES